MTASFPTSLKSFTTKRNGIDIYDAAHVNEIQEEIAAIETMLGVNGSRISRPMTKVVSTTSDGAGDYLCDGTNDDVEIQAAIDAVELLGGGTVIIRRGNYSINTGILMDGGKVQVIGEGIGATVLTKPANSATFSIFNITTDYNVVRDMTLDGGKASAQTMDTMPISISSAGDYNLIQRVELRNAEGTTDLSAGWGIGCSGTHNIIKDCISHDNEAHGILVAGSNNIVTNNLVYLNLQIGIRLSGARCQITGNHVRDCGQHHILNITGDNNIISNNVIDANTGSDTLDTSNTYAGIRLQSTALRNVVVNNRILKSSGTDVFDYGIEEAAAADNSNIIMGNIITDTGTAAILTNGAASDVSHNITA